jgi:hypothetical protein
VNAIVPLEHSIDVLEMAASPLTDDLLIESSGRLRPSAGATLVLRVQETCFS